MCLEMNGDKRLKLISLANFWVVFKRGIEGFLGVLNVNLTYSRILGSRLLAFC